MDTHLKDALIKSINVLVEGADIQTLSQLRHNTSFLLQLVTIIEPGSCIPLKSDEENLKEICNVVNRYFQDIVDADSIMVRGEIEMAKLICLLVNLTLTCEDGDIERRTKAVEDVQKLPNEVQTHIMKMIKVVCDHREDDKLSTVLTETLCCKSDVKEHVSSVNSSPEAHDGSYLFGTPGANCPQNNIGSSYESPIGRYLGSAQYLYRKVMVENTQLKKAMHSKYNERIEVAENKIMDLREEIEKLEKEKEHQLQKTKDLEDTIVNLNKDNEYLVNESSEKDKLISGQEDQMKLLKGEMKGLMVSTEEKEDLLRQLQEKNMFIEEEKVKSKELLQKIREIETQHNHLKDEYRKIKESSDQVMFQMEKMKLDHSDYVSHLKEEITRLERQNLPSEVSQESLAESIRREVEVNSLKTEVQRLKEEIQTFEERTKERSESHEKQASQYMDQITVLIKQVEEQTVRNEGLSCKITTMDKKYKLLEKGVEKLEEGAKQLDEEVQQRSEEVREKNSKITALFTQLESEKTRHEEEKLSLQVNFNTKFDEQQQVFDDIASTHKNVLEETKLQFSTEQGRCKQQINQLEALILQQKEDINMYVEKNSEKEKEIEKKTIELESTRKTSNDLKERISQQKLENEKFQVDAADKIKCLKEEVERNTMTTADVENCQEQIKSCNKEIQDLKNENKVLEEQINSLKTTKEEEANSFKKQNMQYMDQISALLKQINDHCTRNDMLNEKVMSLEEKCKHMEADMESANKQSSDQIMTKTNELERCQSSIAQIETEKCTLDEQNRSQKEKIESLEKEKSALLEEEENHKKQICQLTAEVERLQTLIEQKDMLIGTYSEENKDLSATLEKKDEIIQELERRLTEEEVHNLQLSEANRSSDLQIQSANNTIKDLKKKLSSFKENIEVSPHDFLEENLQQTFGHKGNRRQTYAVVDSRRQTFAVEHPFTQQHRPMHTILQSPDDELDTSEICQEALSMDDLNITKTHKGDRRSVLSLPIMKEEESDASDIDDNPLRRTYSLQEKPEKRRSLQSRRYMAGLSPPDRRTSLGDKSFVHMAAFVTEADEPDELDGMEWNKIARLKETMKSEENLCDDEKNRIAELQRRNTLCLPHLRSAYPMELSVSEIGEDNAERTIREGNDTISLKRKCTNDCDPNMSFKKTKRTIVTRAVDSVVQESRDDEIDVKPAKAAISFDIDFEPPKAAKPKITRSQASAHLLKSRELKSQSSSNLEINSKQKTESPVAKKSSSTGGLKKTLVNKNVRAKVASEKVQNRRLTRTLKKPSNELKESVMKTNKTVKKPLNEVKETNANKTATKTKTGGKFSREDPKRSSFSKAKTRVAASLRGKK